MLLLLCKTNIIISCKYAKAMKFKVLEFFDECLRAHMNILKENLGHPYSL